MTRNITIDKLREYLNDSSARLQTLFSKTNTSVDIDLLDELAKEYHYMFSTIIDYLEQLQ